MNDNVARLDSAFLCYFVAIYYMTLGLGRFFFGVCTPLILFLGPPLRGGSDAADGAAPGRGGHEAGRIV